MKNTFFSIDLFKTRMREYYIDTTLNGPLPKTTNGTAKCFYGLSSALFEADEGKPRAVSGGIGNAWKIALNELIEEYPDRVRGAKNAPPEKSPYRGREENTLQRLDSLLVQPSTVAVGNITNTPVKITINDPAIRALIDSGNANGMLK